MAIQLNKAAELRTLADQADALQDKYNSMEQYKREFYDLLAPFYDIETNNWKPEADMVMTQTQKDAIIGALGAMIASDSITDDTEN